MMSQLDPNDPIANAEHIAAVDEPAPLPIAIASRELRDSQTRSFDRWMVALVTLAVGTCCLLISASKGTKEGMIAWAPNSVLHGLVELLNFNSAYPTFRGICVKTLAQNLAAAVALMGAAVVWHLRMRRDDDAFADDVAVGEAATPCAPATTSRKGWDIQQNIPATVAQFALLAFAGWAMLSCRWAHFPQGALNEGMRAMMVAIWAVAIGRTITRRGALRAAVGLVAMLLITAIVGLWYYYERNPKMRLEFPIGGPIFFAACMLPAIALSLAALAWVIEYAAKSQRPACTSSVSADPVSATVSAWVPWTIGVGAIVVIGVVGWAFVLTRSRSPQVAMVAALAMGFAILLMRHISAKYRRLLVLVVIAAALLGVLFVGVPWWRSQLRNQAGGRAASTRLRLQTWQYAGELFGTRPLTGHGQGGYLLLSQRQACMPRDAFGRSDIECDPSAFTAEMIGHAHNEFLEILADLGVVGFALMVTALGLTVWVGVRAFVVATRPAEKWCLLGLIVGLVAIIIEECADVALRMPGLPIIFYTVIGLIWAMSLPSHDMRAVGTRLLPVRLRPVGLLGAIILSVMIMSAAQRDWRGAIADGQVESVASQGRWDEAMGLADAGRQNRLVLEDDLSARLHLTWSALNAGNNCFQQIVGTLNRQKPPINAGRVKKLIESDLARFDYYHQVCLGSGQENWAIMPFIRSTSEWMAQSMLLKARLESIKQQIGLESENKPFVAAAKELMYWEYKRNRLNAAAALRVYELSANMPMEVRVDLLRIPLRSGPEVPLRAAVEARVAQLVADERASLNHQLEVLTQVADAAATQSADATTQPAGDGQPDPYVPEALRLQAMAARFSGNPGLAAELADKAVRMYESPAMRMYHPTVLSYGLLDRARYLLLSDPANAGLAVSACRRAIDEWPVVSNRDEQLRPLRRDLSLYLLAAGDDGGASDLIRQEAGDLDDARLQRNIGYGLVELCGMFMDRPAKNRPAVFQQWLNRSLQLAPDEPRVRWFAVQVSLDDGNGADAVKHLKAVEVALDDPRQMASMVATLAERYPQNRELAAYVAAQVPTSGPSDTQPADSRPAGIPHPATVPDAQR